MADTNSVATMLDPTVIGSMLAAIAIAVIVVGSPRMQLPGHALLAGGWAMLVATILPSSLTHHALPVVLVAGMGVAAAVAVGPQLQRRPRVVAVLLGATLPIRVPLTLGGERYSLLLGLYLVLGLVLAAQVQASIRAWRTPVKPTRPAGGPSALLVGAAAAWASWSVASVAWSYDRDPAAIKAALFTIPFAMLFVIVRDMILARDGMSYRFAFKVGHSGERDSRAGKNAGSVRAGCPDATEAAVQRANRVEADGADSAVKPPFRAKRPMTHLECESVSVLRWGAFGLLGTMSVAATAGIYQAVTHVVWQNPKVIIANRFAPDFRTNSIFWDPNIYGRYLVAALVILCVAGAFRSRSSRVVLALWVGAAAALLIALWFTYSQSSFIALGGAAFVITLYLISRRARLLSVAVAALLLIGGFGVARSVGVLHDPGRIRVAEGGLALMEQRPFYGLGTGSFEGAYGDLQRMRGSRAPKLRSSHSTPVTLAAELGVAGLGLYLALLAGVVIAARPAVLSASPRWLPVGAWASAMFMALFLHSLLYAGFFEDPLVWIVIGLLAGSADRAASGSVCP